VVEYSQDYLEAENLSRVENCFQCLLHCKKRVIDKIVRMFFIREQESA
jgi:aldehyde:ferredoxin oxidoreductase